MMVAEYEAPRGASVYAGDFLTRLRQATRSEHARVETSFEPMNSQPSGRLRDFLQAQYLALRTLRDRREGSELPDEARLLDTLLDDLSAEGFRPQDGWRTDGAGIDALAVGYIVFGSRNGAEVLRRRYAEAGVDPMPAYLAHRNHVPGWKAVCAALRAIPPDGERAKRILADVREAFLVYCRAAQFVGRNVAADPSDLVVP